MIAMRITFFTLALSIAASPAFLVSEALLSLRRLRVDTPLFRDFARLNSIGGRVTWCILKFLLSS